MKRTHVLLVVAAVVVAVSPLAYGAATGSLTLGPRPVVAPTVVPMVPTPTVTPTEDDGVQDSVEAVLGRAIGQDVRKGTRGHAAQVRACDLQVASWEDGAHAIDPFGVMLANCLKVLDK